MIPRRLALQFLLGGALQMRLAPHLRALERQIFDAINSERSRRGVKPLAWDDNLATEARRHSLRMATRSFFSHSDPERGDLVPRLKEDGIEWHACAENILQAQDGGGDLVAAAVRSWMESRGHRKNLMNATYTRSAVGIAESRDQTLYFTQDFLRP